ncbi:4-galactosyl-N-acetylglucosaminide 3-alpha-L-fucosyltransferase FUT6-like [Mercenaria mercenaria]|uniref:4-galactosyl-N-acetylglucosaminide 3-alpha-L-fucosyltransferase FUT6-like n=1 Tax=Mercenaria mercenaria TaxID=6596 RepID=UPI00234F4100|nr:4-galactosyl-N-acetylglucosaminide 3-alpha-L-fucosyltransferase FUT6-like [Mercenaria mercenaria]
MRRKFSLRNALTFIICVIVILTITGFLHTVLYPHSTRNKTKACNDIWRCGDYGVKTLNISKTYPEDNVNNALQRKEVVEDYTLHNLLDPKEQFDNHLMKFGENEKLKVILLFNKPGFENETTTNEKFKTCEYNNCRMTSNKRLLNTADAILFDICNSDMGTEPPIDKQSRNPNQAWIFKCGETPIHHWFDDYKSNAWHNTMNWSISYRIDSDMPHPYGYLKTRTFPRQFDYESIYRSKTKTALWVVSNCNTQSARDQYVAELQRYGVDVDVYGKCGSNENIDNETLNRIIPKYKFYLGFENSLCNDYITEKFFFYYDFNWIVVVQGGADYDRLLPTKSYINTAHFSNVSLLADYLLNLGNDKDRYIDFLRKKDRYEQKYEYGHKYSICEMCRRLNKVSAFRKTYNNIQDYLENGQCRMPTDVQSVSKPSAFLNYERVFS